MSFDYPRFRAWEQHGNVRGDFSFGSRADTQGLFAHPAITIPADMRIAEMQSHINNHECSDVCFVVEGQQVHAHKIILAAHSQCFRKMLGSNMLEGAGGGDIQIQDVSIKTFKHIPQHLHTGGVQCDSLEDCQLLLIASDMHQLNRLKAICEPNISQHVTVENVISILLDSSRHSADGLKRFAMDFVMSNWNDQVIKESISILDDEPCLMREVLGCHTLLIGKPSHSSFLAREKNDLRDGCDEQV